MSVEAFNRVLSAKVGDGTRKWILAGLANHAHKDGRNAWPTVSTLAGYAECDRRTAQRHLKRLQVDGWIRPGDQQQVAHLRGDRRPVVWDIAMTEEIRAEWAADAAAPAPGDRTPPRDDQGATVHDMTERRPVTASRDDTPAAPSTTHGVTKSTPRGDTAVSPEPKEPSTTPPSPRTPGGDSHQHNCPRHGTTQAPNCRNCGTTARQIAEANQRQAAADRRRQSLDQIAEQRRRRAEATPPPAELLRQTRSAIRESRT